MTALWADTSRHIYMCKIQRTPLPANTPEPSIESAYGEGTYVPGLQVIASAQQHHYRSSTRRGNSISATKYPKRFFLLDFVGCAYIRQTVY